MANRTEPARAAAAPLLALALLAGAAGCGEADPEPRFRRQTTRVEDVPAPVLNAARKALPGVEFDEAWRNLDPGSKLLSYEVRGRTANGKVREVRVAPGGEILEME